MSDQDAFERILASLHDAMLDDARWPAVSALIDEACGIEGNDLLVGEGPKDDVRVLVVGLYRRGRRREDLERDYLERVVGDALPTSGPVAVSGSMLLRRSAVSPPFVVARQAGGRPPTGLRRAARRRAGADCRAGTPSACRSGLGGHDPGSDAGGESGGGLVGGRQERAGHGRGDWTHGGRHLLAPEGDLPEAVHLAAGGPGTIGVVARGVRRSFGPSTLKWIPGSGQAKRGLVSAPLPAFSTTRRRGSRDFGRGSGVQVGTVTRSRRVWFDGMPPDAARSGADASVQAVGTRRTRTRLGLPGQVAHPVIHQSTAPLK